MTVVAGGIHQRHRNRSHTEWFAVSCAGEDHIFHARTAQTFGGLLTQNPTNRIAQVGFSTAVGANDRRDPRTGKFHLGSVKEGLEALDLNSLQFQQSTAPSYYQSLGGTIPYYPRVGRK